MKAVKTILFVENDPVSLTMYQNRLQREGFYIETAQDGLTALRILSQSTPDLVVLDLMLPRFTGAEVFKIMRTDKRLNGVPVVIFSNAAMTEWPQDVNVGATRCLAKSDSTFPMLLQTIQEMLAASPVDSAPMVQTETNNGSGQSAPPSPTTMPPAAGASTGPKGRSEFLQAALAEIPKLRELCLAYIKAPATESSQQYLVTLQQRVLYFHTSASQYGCTRIALLANVFGTLLSEIMAKPSWATTSVLQTMAQAVDCLRFLLNSGETNAAQPAPKAKVLAVDDDPVCNHVIVTTLRRANFDPITVENPLAALDLLQNNQYDLVLLDVNMPEMTGFQLCEKLRRIPHCKTIPVVFVTAFNNFDNRKQSVLSGGNDFITKPISPLELALKVTIHMIKSHVQRASSPAVEFAPGEALRDPSQPTQVTQTAAFGNDSVDGTKSGSLPAADSADSRSVEEEMVLAMAPPLPTEACPPNDSQDSLPPAESVPNPEPEQPEMEKTVSASALEPSTESHTTDVEQVDPPVTDPLPFESSPVSASDDVFQPAASIPAPQLDKSLVASLAPSSVFVPAGEGTPESAEFANSASSPTLSLAAESPVPEAAENPIPSAAIPVDMFDRNPVERSVPASALESPTESRTGNAENAAAPQTESSPAPENAIQPADSIQTSATEQVPVEASAPADTSASSAPESQTVAPENVVTASAALPSTEPGPVAAENTLQPADSTQNTAPKQPIDAEDADLTKALESAFAEFEADHVENAVVPTPAPIEPEPVVVPEPALQPAASLSTSATETVSVESVSKETVCAETVSAETVPTDNTKPVETPAPVTAEAPGSDAKDAAAPIAEPVTSESVKAATVAVLAIQDEITKALQSAIPLPDSTPAVIEKQTSSMQTQNNQTAFDKIVVEVAKLIFGDNNLTELNLRLVRAALERSDVHRILNGPTNTSC